MEKLPLKSIHFNTNYHGIEFKESIYLILQAIINLFFPFGKNVKKRLFGKAKSILFGSKRSQNTDHLPAFPC